MSRARPERRLKRRLTDTSQANNVAPVPKRACTEPVIDKKHQCTHCQKEIIMGAHYDGRDLVCQGCYALIKGQTLIANPSAHLWKNCSPLFWHYFVNTLGRLVFYLKSRDEVAVTDQPTAKAGLRMAKHLTAIFGPGIGTTFWKPHLQSLLKFAFEEDVSYGFDSIGFSQCRMERACSPETMDFWLTLCVTYDLDNYLMDLLKPCAPLD
jgi:hypothetical protein